MTLDEIRARYMGKKVMVDPKWWDGQAYASLGQFPGTITGIEFVEPYGYLYRIDDSTGEYRWCEAKEFTAD